MTQTIVFPIHGMTCPSCASRIARALGRLDGVASARVDLATDSATVTFDPQRTPAEEIGRAVTASGYDPEMGAAHPIEAKPQVARASGLRLPLAVSVGCLLALGLLIGAGVPLGSLLPFAGLAACLGMHLLMRHGPPGS